MLETGLLPYIITAIVSYLAGSIPFGVVLTKLLGRADIRSQGSGNIGATNMARIYGKKLGAITLVLDGIKGWVAITLCTSIFTGDSNIAVLSGLFAVAGHIFPVWLKFKGGKGVATTLVVYLTLFWPAGIAACGAWVVTFMLTKISSLAALVAMVVAPIVASMIVPGSTITWVFMTLTLLVIARHKDNIGRLLKGEEKNFKKKD